jgi:hypothetical protein
MRVRTKSRIPLYADYGMPPGVYPIDSMHMDGPLVCWDDTLVALKEGEYEMERWLLVDLVCWGVIFITLAAVILGSVRAWMKARDR